MDSRKITLKSVDIWYPHILIILPQRAIRVIVVAKSRGNGIMAAARS